MSPSFKQFFSVLAFAAIFSVVSVVVTARDAHADIVVAVEGDYSMPVGEWLETPGAGLGVQGRVGYTLPLPFLSIGFEVLGRYQDFPADTHEADFTFWQTGGGLRAGIGIPGVGIEPSAFVHLGYGALEGLGSDYVINHDGLVVDGGLALDYTALPFIDVGLHGSYSVLYDSQGSNPSVPSESQWMSVGLHLELNL